MVQVGGLASSYVSPLPLLLRATTRGVVAPARQHVVQPGLHCGGGGRHDARPAVRDGEHKASGSARRAAAATATTSGDAATFRCVRGAFRPEPTSRGPGKVQ